MAYDYGFSAAVNDKGYVRPSFLVTLEECTAYALGYALGCEIRQKLAVL